MRSLVKIVFIVLILLLTACGIQPVRTIAGNEGSMAFGNISTPEGTVARVIIYNLDAVYKPPYRNPPLAHIFSNGDFMFENLRPGRYLVAGFITSNQSSYNFNYDGKSKQELQQFAIEIKSGDVAYLGSYKISLLPDQLPSDKSFDITKVTQPSQHEILHHLKSVTDGTGWDEKIKSHLAKTQITSLKN
jgi:hypothetical protein